MQMASVKRGSHFVNCHVQGALIGRTIFHWAFFLFSLCALVFVLHLVSSLAAGETTDPLAIGVEIWDRHRIVFMALMALVPFFCLDLVLWSHRFAGPMIRIRRSMHSMAEGKPVSPIQLRARDYWKNLADDFNLLLMRIEAAEKQSNVQTSQPSKLDEILSVPLSSEPAELQPTCPA